LRKQRVPAHRQAAPAPVSCKSAAGSTTEAKAKAPAKVEKKPKGGAKRAAAKTEE